MLGRIYLSAKKWEYFFLVAIDIIRIYIESK